MQGALWEAVLPCSGHLCIYSQVPSGGPALPPTPGQHSRPALWKRRKWSREEPGQAGTSVLVAVFACDDDLQSKIVLASLLPSKPHKSTSLSQCQHVRSQGPLDNDSEKSSSHEKSHLPRRDGLLLPCHEPYSPRPACLPALHAAQHVCCGQALT